MEPDDYKSIPISWDLSRDYKDLLEAIVKSDAKKKFNPDTITPDQAVRHAETPALKRAWDDYITLWKLTHD